MEVDGRGAGCFVGGLVLAGIVIVVVFVGLTLTSGIASSQADRAGAVALAEQAKAAVAQARVDEVEVEADRDVQMQLDRQGHELALLREENRQFQERLLFLATIVEGMDGRQVNRLERLLGGDSTWLSVAVAAFLAVVVFALFLALRWYINRRWEKTWTT